MHKPGTRVEKNLLPGTEAQDIGHPRAPPLPTPNLIIAFLKRQAARIPRPPPRALPAATPLLPLQIFVSPPPPFATGASGEESSAPPAPILQPSDDRSQSLLGPPRKDHCKVHFRLLKPAEVSLSVACEGGPALREDRSEQCDRCLLRFVARLCNE